MHARQLMTTNVLSCREEDSLERAAQLMWEGDVGAIPVVDAERRLIGLITDRDICMAAYTQGCGLAARSVGGVMSQEVYTCRPGDSVAFVEEQMRRHQVRRLPVVDDGRLVGIVSLNDLALTAGKRRVFKTGRVTLAGVATTLARICEHRRPAAAAAE